MRPLQGQEWGQDLTEYTQGTVRFNWTVYTEWTFQVLHLKVEKYLTILLNLDSSFQQLGYVCLLDCAKIAVLKLHSS